jgi:hypothetical protein
MINAETANWAGKWEIENGEYVLLLRWRVVQKCLRISTITDKQGKFITKKIKSDLLMIVIFDQKKLMVLHGE